MRENERLPLLDLRQQIHDLTVTKKSTGLSPPQEQILDYLEAMEASAHEPRSSE